MYKNEVTAYEVESNAVISSFIRKWSRIVRKGNRNHANIDKNSITKCIEITDWRTANFRRATTKYATERITLIAADKPEFIREMNP